MKDIEWINTHEAAQRLGITTRTLYRFIDQGQLNAYRFGRVFRLQLSDIETFIESCKVEPGTLKHLYPDTQIDDLGFGDNVVRETDANATDTDSGTADTAETTDTKTAQPKAAETQQDTP